MNFKTQLDQVMDIINSDTLDLDELLGLDADTIEQIEMDSESEACPYGDDTEVEEIEF